MPLRFEANYNDAGLSFDPLVDEVFSELKSSFLEMPRGEGFVDYATFERGYQSLKKATNAFATEAARSRYDADCSTCSRYDFCGRQDAEHGCRYRIANNTAPSRQGGHEGRGQEHSAGRRSWSAVPCAAL